MIFFSFSSYVQSFFSSATTSSNSLANSGQTNTTNSAGSDKKCKKDFDFKFLSLILF